MLVKLRRLVKSLSVVCCTALVLAFINTLLSGNVGVSRVEELSASLKHGEGRDQPNGVRVIKRSLMQNGSANKLNVSLGAVKEEILNRSIGNVSKTVKKSTDLDDVFISVKTTKKFHDSRVKLQLETWWTLAQEQTYFFTDENDEEYQKWTRGHMINTNCSNKHTRQGLCCKFSIEFDYFIQSEKKWFCHVDDDTYVNVVRLVEFLKDYDPAGLWYLGKPSLSHPIEIRDPDTPGQKLAFWFATGGAGVCLSRAMALRIMPFASGGKFNSVCNKIRLADDCSLGYVITKLANLELTKIPYFHSHLEGLWSIKGPSLQLRDQLTLSYGDRPNNRKNVVNIPGFSEKQDPTRLHSVHCYLYPDGEICKRATQPVQ